MATIFRTIIQKSWAKKVKRKQNEFAFDFLNSAGCPSNYSENIDNRLTDILNDKVTAK